jgi:hypothetical protein
MQIEISQIQPRIFFAKFADQKRMCLAATRIDAKIELKNLKSYLANNVVSGYCFNNKELSKFKAVFTPKSLSEAEKAFLKTVYKAVKDANLKPHSKFAIIVCFHSKHSLTYKHEIAHSMFYVNYSYRQKVLRLFNKIKPEIKEKMMEFLVKNNYRFKGIDDINFADEVNARLSSENVISKAFSEDAQPSSKYINKFKKLYEENVV